MRRIAIGFALVFCQLLCASSARAEGAALYIDADTVYQGMEQTYAQGYVPRVSGGAAHILLPLKTSDDAMGQIRVSPLIDMSEKSPFSHGNYEFNVNKADGVFLIALNLPLKPDRVNGAYPVAFQVSYAADGAAVTQEFTVYVTISDGHDPNWVEPTPGPAPEPVAGQLSIDSQSLYPGMDKPYAAGYMPTVADGRVYLVLPLIGETYDGSVTVYADLGELRDSPFVYGNYSQTVRGWGQYAFLLEIPLAKNRYNGAYPVTLKADYLDVTGKQCSQSFTIHITIADGKTPPDPGDAPKEAVERPELFISACAVTPKTVGGDEQFQVEVNIHNIGSIRARSVRLSFGSEAAGIIPVETNNAMHLANISDGESVAASFWLMTTKDVLAGNQPFYITLDYTDLYGGIYTNTRTFLIEVTQPAGMAYDPVSLPKEIPAGETATLPANVFNIGKSTLRNVTVTLTGAGLFPVSSVFLGDIPPGEAGYGEMKVFIGMLSMSEGYTESYGKTTGIYMISYEDDFGEQHLVETSVSTEIKKPVIEGEKEDGEKPDPAFQWWMSVLIGLAVIAILVTVMVISKFTRMMKMR